MNNETGVSIVIVEDHPLMRKGIKKVIEDEAAMRVVGEAVSANDAIAIIAREEPDIVIVDISLDAEASGIDLITTMRSRGIASKSIVLSMHTEAYYVERAIRAGAMGYLSKSDAPASIIDAIMAVMSGKLYVSGRISGDLIRGLLDGAEKADGAPVDLLSNRELMVFEMIGAGYKSLEIAGKLNISVNTVEAHRKKIRAKLGCASSGELTRHAIAWLHANNRPAPLP
ncbi:MAG TPA: response regulator transcription factor [Spirochaetota bacterium]|nr:response regulator transcription factor [Spirochaetota bacterium]HPU87591.1 response regulator transcription factor [Spirochaetota bacterium]